jgi:hypothetical protein
MIAAGTASLRYARPSYLLRAIADPRASAAIRSGVTPTSPVVVAATADHERLRERPAVAFDRHDRRVDHPQVPAEAGEVLEDVRVAVALDARGDVMPEVER